MKTVGELRAALRLLPDETSLCARCSGDSKLVSVEGGKIMFRPHTKDTNRMSDHLVLVLDVDPKKEL